MLQFTVLGSDCNIFHFITTRHGGTGRGAYGTFNVSPFCGDSPEAVAANRNRLVTTFDLNDELFFLPRQVHGTDIGDLNDHFMQLSPEDQTAYLENRDALVTALPDVCIGISTADCVPLLLHDPKKGVIAVIHAGWRGTVNGIVSKTIAYLIEHYQVDPAGLRAGIGPSISCEAFEVGEEVAAEFREKLQEADLLIHYNRQTGKPHIDLWEANRQQLLQAGVPDKQIEIAEICTFTRHDDWFSARRSGINSGRIVSALRMNSEKQKSEDSSSTSKT